MSKTIYTAEAVSKGHPDKFCDAISDAVLDACLTVDDNARVACEVFATKGLIVVGGEITSEFQPDYKGIVQEAAVKAGYDLDNTELIVTVHEQSPDIAGAVDKPEQGAGDQGIMVGYACDDTLDFLPLEYAGARRIIERLEAMRESGRIDGIGSDAKSQVSAEFIDGGISDTFERITKIVVSVQHDADKDLDELRAEIKEMVIGFVFADFDLSETEILINPSGRFVIGGLDSDTGLTGRKIVADAYGPRIPVGGGAFSGKDPSKVDRSGAYFARYIARNIVEGGIAEKCLVQIAYAIGKAKPLAVNIDTFGTGKTDDDAIRQAVLEVFDFRPAEIIKALRLKRPIYAAKATGGHFGKDSFPWEQADRVSELRKALFG